MKLENIDAIIEIIKDEVNDYHYESAKELITALINSQYEGD